MPPRDEQSATVVVIELGAGHIYVKIVEPKPEPQRVELLLRKTIEAWFDARPQFVIDREQPVVEAGETLGIQVWYHAGKSREASVNPAPANRPSPLTIEVSESVLQKLPKEYIEAVVDEAIQVWHSQPDRQVSLAVVNARQIVVIVDGQASRGAVLPVEGVLDALDDEQRGRVRTWLGSLPTRLHVIEITGSWFARRDDIWKRGRIAERSVVRTNMTYDSGERPPDRDRRR
ncbi:MAG TPA: hypothetical protein VKA15_01430 [Isosphaeraceae bacterium]|nr:hypothetical protein [Isosphaeraceae bacterium]